MRWRVVVELYGAVGAAVTQEVYSTGTAKAGSSPETLGLTLGQAQAGLAGPGRPATACGSGTNGGALPGSPALLPVWRTTATEGPTPAATAIVVRRRRGRGAPLRAVSVQREPLQNARAGDRHHARSLHAGI